eukprot:Platyproteum_vivax@DN4894_c0_g1_i1.p1
MDAEEDVDMKEREEAIYEEGAKCVKEGRAQDLKKLLEDSRQFFLIIPKARTAKIVRCIIDLVAQIPDTSDLQIELCLESIEWCRKEKRTFLRQRVESRLAGLYLQQCKYQKGLETLKKLLKEVKQLDDRLLLVEIHLTESKLHFALFNVPKAKAALTASRARASGIHCPPLLQADIDLMAGMLHAQEKDYKTAYSYFYEAFECLHLVEDAKALRALKYMLMSRVMRADSCDVTQILSHKNAAKYQGRDIEALKALSKCHQKRSLEMFEATVQKYSVELEKDSLIKNHIAELYETLLEQNLLRIMEPFSRVEISHVANLIKLPVERVQAKLSEMILDSKFRGTLDQGVGLIVVFDDVSVPTSYANVVQNIKQMGLVVDSLYEKAYQLA